MRKDTQAAFMEELEKVDIPFPAILAGIKKLMTDDLKTIKIYTILDAARRYVETEDRERTDCPHCFGSGAVSMIDDQRVGFVLACTCASGHHHKGGKNGLVEWNGETIQYSKGRRLELRFQPFVPQGQ